MHHIIFCGSMLFVGQFLILAHPGHGTRSLGFYKGLRGFLDLLSRIVWCTLTSAVAWEDSGGADRTSEPQKC